MAHPRTQHASRDQAGGGFLLGVFIGLVIGLGIAIGVAFYINKTPLPFIAKSRTPGDEAATQGKPPAIAGMPQGGQGAASGGDKPKFDFYKILPGAEQPVTDKELKERMRAGKSQPGGGKDIYFIQVGSFQNPAEADNQKAKLAILGVESSVEATSLPDKGTWYRVRVGPYTKLDEINRVRQTLAQNGFSASLVKMKDPTTTKAN
ncbi:MAG TPA: SPOR domain-containing protein [Burkholderiales bacterium]|nr:SPOR domain-containing protein [Burkholderiales bacterium]